LAWTTVSMQASPAAPTAVRALATPRPRILHRISAERVQVARSSAGSRLEASHRPAPPRPAAHSVEARARRVPLPPPIDPSPHAAATAAPAAARSLVARRVPVRASTQPRAEAPASSLTARSAMQARRPLAHARIVTDAPRLQRTKPALDPASREGRHVAGRPAVQVHRRPAPTLQQFGSPVPMQWRSAPAVERAMRAPVRVAGGLDLRTPSSERRGAAAEPAVAVVPAAARVAPPAPAFDRAAIDRLADDVMQRIERRIRIERERRGL
jgi:hypothetical protein